MHMWMRVAKYHMQYDGNIYVKTVYTLMVEGQMYQTCTLNR